MRAYELVKETLFRRTYIWVVHVLWLVLYGVFWWLLIPSITELGRFVFIWSGFLLPLALSAGIFGDDIASGRICILVTKPFWSGQLYIYRLLGLSLQAAVHLILAGCTLYILHGLVNKGSIEGLGLWLVASWLLFNTCAALSTSLSTIVGRAYNSLIVLVMVAAAYSVVNLLLGLLGPQAANGVFLGFIQYVGPPFRLLYKLASGEHGKYALTFGPCSLTYGVASVIHSLMLTVVYGIVGIVLFSRREFSRARD